MMNVEETITERLHRRGFIAGSGHGDDYVSAGIIDSLDLLGWVLDLEDQFDVEITDADVMSDGFRTISGLTRLIEEKINDR